MATAEVRLEVKAMLVREKGTCLILKPGDEDSDALSVILPEGGYQALCVILFDALPERELFEATIDALINAAYQIGRLEGEPDYHYLEETHYKQLRLPLTDMELDQ